MRDLWSFRSPTGCRPTTILGGGPDGLQGGRRHRLDVAWRRSKDPLPCRFLEAGEGYVAVRWGDVVVVEVYLAPSLDRATFEERLERIRDCVDKYAPSPTIVAGDFNAVTNVGFPAH